MVNAPKTLAKTQAGTIDPEALASPSGGQGPAVTGYDVAGAAGYGGLASFDFLVGLAKYAQDARARNEVWRRIKSECLRQLADREHTWPGLAEALTNLALEEVVDEPVCHKCRGNQTRIILGVRKSCPTCQGTGRRVLSERARADRLNVSKRTWQRRWRSIYDEVVRQVDEAEQLCLRAIGRHLE